MATTTVTISFDVVVDNASVPYIRNSFGGGTNQQTLDAVKAWAQLQFLAAFWPKVVADNLNRQRETDMATVRNNEAALRASIEALEPNGG